MEEPRDETEAGEDTREGRGSGLPAGGPDGGGREIPVTDRRFWAREEGPDAGAPRRAPRQSAYPSYVEELQAAASAREEELSRIRQAHTRMRDENRARIQRLERGLDLRLEMATGEVLGELLEVADNLDLAVQHAAGTSDVQALLEGVKMVREAFLQKLERLGAERVACLGSPFDPSEAEAMNVREVEDPVEHDVVLEELRAGYRFKGKVLRPAQVVVGRCPTAKAPAEEEPPAAAGEKALEVMEPPEEDTGRRDPAPPGTGEGDEDLPAATVVPPGQDVGRVSGPAVSPADVDFEPSDEDPDHADALDWDRH